MPVPETQRRSRAAVVYNPIKVDLGVLRRTVAEAEADHGWEPSLWLETSVEDPGTGVTTEALEKGASLILAAGGDGTVRAVAEALRGTGVPLGMLPSGTGNLLARNLDLTLDDLPGSVHAAFTGVDRAVDLGIFEAERADGTRESYAFLVMAGVGLDALMIANTNPKLKKRVGWLAYVDAIARSLRDSEQIRIRYQLDGGPRRVMRAHTVLIGNCGSLPANILLLPEAAVDDGVLDIVALRPEGFFGWVQVWVKIVWENGVLRRSQVGRKLLGLSREVRTLRYMKGQRLILRLDREEEFELDGDAGGKAVAMRISVDPGAVIVRVPREAVGAVDNSAGDVHESAGGDDSAGDGNETTGGDEATGEAAA